MEKLIYLFDFEFKQNLKHYITTTIALCTFLMIEMVVNLQKYNQAIKSIIGKQKIHALEDTLGATSFSTIIDTNCHRLITVGIVLILAYSIAVWNKDFLGKNKSIYTLAMIPENRMNIYISKLLNVISFMYIYLISIISTLFVAYKILPRFMLGNVVDMGFSQEISFKLSSILPLNMVDFVVGYVFTLIATISTIFTVILIKKSSKRLKGINAILFYIGMIVMGYFIFAFIMLNKNMAGTAIIYSTLLAIASMLRGRKILNDGIDF